VPGLFDHIDQNGAGFGGGGYLAKEGDACAFDAVRGLDADVEAEAVDRGHGGGFGFQFGVGAGEEDEGFGVVGVHVVEDALRCVGERVGLGGCVVRGGDPAHDAEAADVVDIDGVKAEEGEVVEVDPVEAVGVGLEVEFACFGLFFVGDLGDVADEGDTGRAEDVAVGCGLGDEEAGPWVGLEVLGVHGHGADEKEGAAGGVEGVGHEGAEGEAGLLAGEGGEGGYAGEVEERAGALGVGRLRNRRLRVGVVGCGVLVRHDDSLPVLVWLVMGVPPPSHYPAVKCLLSATYALLTLVNIS
jgi:hypothetical protein